jgi:hypothetical protein
MEDTRTRSVIVAIMKTAKQDIQIWNTERSVKSESTVLATYAAPSMLGTWTYGIAMRCAPGSVSREK